MLTQDHLENFNQATIRLWIPQFTLDQPDHDKIWCLFWWMIGQNWGFDKMYQFHWADYRGITDIFPSSSVVGQAAAWNRRLGRWLKWGVLDHTYVFAIFPRSDWEFVEWECVDPRMQRIWIHLYNQVLSAGVPRADLFHEDPNYKSPSFYTDTWWWGSNKQFSYFNSMRTASVTETLPHYLGKQAQKRKRRLKPHETL